MNETTITTKIKNSTHEKEPQNKQRHVNAITEEKK